MSSPDKVPFYAKAALLLVGFYILIQGLYVMQDVLIPLIYATLIAILVSPVVAYLTKKIRYRSLAIVCVMLCFLVVLAAIAAFISSQVNHLSQSWPQLSARFEEIFKQALLWGAAFFDISTDEMNTWISDTQNRLINNAGTTIGSTFSTMGGILATTFLTPVYIFMILLYQPHLVSFIHQVFGAGNDEKVSEILIETKSVIQGFLSGLFMELLIVGVLNALGLTIIGLDYAVLLGFAGALLNIIPYLGGMIAMLIFMTIALITKSPVYALYVIMMYSVIQFIDNNYIVPKIVGSKVKLNPLVSIIAVIAGAALWGLPGMFLFIPLTAVLKLILDRIESLKPWGFLLGDSLPPLIKLK